MTVAETLAAAYATLATKYAAAAASAAPSYSIDGQSVNRTEYMESLMRQMQSLKLQIAAEDGPTILETQGFV